jgi:hypothetical protein
VEKVNERALYDGFDRAKQLIDAAEEMQDILVDFYVNGFWHRADEELDAVYVKVGDVLSEYDKAYDNLI